MPADELEVFKANLAKFRDELEDLLTRTVVLSRSCSIVESVNEESVRGLVELVDDQDSRSVEILANGVACAKIQISYGCRPDQSGKYLAVTESTYKLASHLEGTPLFRLEFEDHARGRPTSHWHVHAERGALSSLLTQSGHKSPHTLSALHIPVGGTRFRPGLEDFLHFAIRELRADGVEGWETALAESRERWRRMQIAATVRDVPDEAARVLAQLGYTVIVPEGGDPIPKRDTLRRL